MPSCSCKEHDSFSNNEVCPVVKLTSKKIKVNTIDYMKEKGLISKHASALCEKCVRFVEDTLMKNKKVRLGTCESDVLEFIETNDISPAIIEAFVPKLCKYLENCVISEDSQKMLYCFLIQTMSSETMNLHVNKMCSLIDSKTLPLSSSVLLAQTLGKSISSDIYNDSISVGNKYQDMECLGNLSVKEWLHARNVILTAFLKSAADLSDEADSKKMLCISGSVDSLYKARRLTYVAPLPFCSNLVTYYITNSQTAAQLASRQQASGSYWTLWRWLKERSIQECARPSTSDVVSFFDNNQVVARNWRVNYGHKTQASVVTTVVHIQPSLPTNIQQSPDLSPRVWLLSDMSTVVPLIMDYFKEGSKSYDIIRNQYLDNRLKLVQQQLQVTDKGLVDYIDNRISGMDTEVPKANDDPYSWVPTMHPASPPTVQLGEPAMVNPCSYEAVKNVLKHIQHIEDVPGKRSWSCIGCDGLPYTLGSRLLESTDQLKDILLIPGHGHLEMNAVRAVFKLLWDVVLKDLALLLGFRSPRAQVCCQACNDHHKSWMILNIFLFGTMDEILTIYIRDCNETGNPISVKGLYSFISNKTNKNCRFMCDIIFNYILAIFIFRCGVRRNNSDYIKAGKSKFSKLFFGVNMTTYQEIIVRDAKTRVLAPPLVQQFLNSSESFSLSGHHSKGEGGDFVLESFNGKTKRWLPPGVPSRQHWLQVCRNLGTLDKIRERTFNVNELKTPEKEGIYQRDLTKEIMEWRVHLRKKGYLISNDNIHVSISQEAVDEDLIIFERLCEKNFVGYLETVKQGHKLGKSIPLVPIFTTHQARSKFYSVEKKKKTELQGIIDQLLLNIRGNGAIEEALILEQQWTKIRAKTKNDILHFYNEVVIALENSSVEESDSEEDAACGHDEDL